MKIKPNIIFVFCFADMWFAVDPVRFLPLLRQQASSAVEDAGSFQRSSHLTFLSTALLYSAGSGHRGICGSAGSCCGVLGHLSSHILHPQCVLFSVVVLLLTESVMCLAITLWPHCLGISLDESQMVRSLKNNYGVPGQELFTNAMDLAQVHFGCCGMKSSLDYDTSLWRLQGYGQRSWSVPLSCCLLENALHPLAYLDPKPANESLCQSVDRLSYERERNSESCLPHLDEWYRKQYSIFLAASLILAVVEFCVLLGIIMSCTGLASQRAKLKNVSQQMRTQKRRAISVKSRETLIGNLYEPEVELNMNSIHSIDEIYLGAARRHVSSEDFKELGANPKDLYNQHHIMTRKPISIGNCLI